MAVNKKLGSPLCNNPQVYQLRNGGVCQYREYCESEGNEAGEAIAYAAVPRGGCGEGEGLACFRWLSDSIFPCRNLY